MRGCAVDQDVISSLDEESVAVIAANQHVTSISTVENIVAQPSEQKVQ